MFMKSALCMVCVLFVSSQASAEFLVDVKYDVSQTGQSFWTYTYTVRNISTQNESLWAFTVGFDFDVSLTELNGPERWYTAYTPGDTQAGWLSLDAGDDIGVESVGVFSFVADRPPAQVLGVAEGYDGVNTYETVFDVIGPSPTAVPEVSAFMMLGCAAGGFLLCKLAVRSVGRRAGG